MRSRHSHRRLVASVCLMLLHCGRVVAFVSSAPFELTPPVALAAQWPGPRAARAALPSSYSGRVRTSRARAMPLRPRTWPLGMSSPGEPSAGDAAAAGGQDGDGGSAHFINLSNGAESLPLLQKLSVPYSYTRMQSSHCESQNFDGILSNLGPTLLIHLAMGTTCYIHDYGSRNKKRKAPRAVWYGVTFVKYALHKLWDLEGEPATPVLRGHNVSGEFDRAISRLDKGVKKQVRYYANYLRSRRGCVRLYGVVGSTDIDGRRDLHAALVHDHAASGGLLLGGERGGEVLEAVVESGMMIFDTDVGFVLGE